MVINAYKVGRQRFYSVWGDHFTANEATISKQRECWEDVLSVC